MHITINGKLTEIEDAATIADIVELQNLKTSMFAVEQNHQIIPKSQYKSIPVQEGDRIEIVHFVGGG